MGKVDTSAPHVVSAFAAGMGVVLGQTATACKKRAPFSTKPYDAPGCRRSACRTAHSLGEPPMRHLAHLLVVAITSLAIPAAVPAAPAAEPLRLGVGLFQPDKPPVPI